MARGTSRMETMLCAMMSAGRKLIWLRAFTPTPCWIMKASNRTAMSSLLPKWPVDAEKCRMYWGRMGKPCTICISVCPFNKDMRGWFHKLVRWAVDHTRWADPIYVKMDDLFGYGKPKKAEDFWDEWQPRGGH